MEQYEQLLKRVFLDKTLTDIEFFDHDLRYVSPDMEQMWIVDGGVQFHFDDEYVSFAYSGEFQFFNIFLGKVQELPNDFEMKPLGAMDVEGIKSLIGKTVVDVKAIWNFYKELDEDFEEIDEKKYMPFEILVTFNDGSFLQIAAIEFKILDNQIVNLHYNSERDIVISLNKKLTIGDEL